MTSHISTIRWSNFKHRGPKVGVFLKSIQATPCGHYSKWKLTPENLLWTSCPWLPWPWFSCEKSLKILKVVWEVWNFERHFKNLYLAGRCVWRAQIGLVWKLVSRATHSVLQIYYSHYLLKHRKAMNEPRKMFKWPWKFQVLLASSKFCLWASLKMCDLQILGTA
jgi:hypothetical protein